MSKPFAKSFYNSQKWITTRDYIFKKQYGICQECGAPGEEVHHKIHLTINNIGNPDIALDEKNLILLCKNCHFQKHRETNPLEQSFKKKKLTLDGYYFDENGELQECKRYIVYGSPGSGKTTYVKKIKQDGDCAIDLDYIMQAISLENKSNIPENLLKTAIEIREGLYRQIEENKIDSKNIWIIGSLPKKKEREQLKKRLKAELVFIDRSIEQCIENVLKDEERTNKKLQVSIVKKWFEHYEQ